jgi:hypothetical protein
MLSLQQFEPLVGQPFDWPDAGGAAVLLQARPLGMAAAGARVPFALLFEGPAQPVLPQRTYALGHPALKGVEVFLVPVARQAGGVHYEAVFT